MTVSGPRFETWSSRIRSGPDHSPLSNALVKNACSCISIRSQCAQGEILVCVMIITDVSIDSGIVSTAGFISADKDARIVTRDEFGNLGKKSGFSCFRAGTDSDKRYLHLEINRRTTDAHLCPSLSTSYNDPRALKHR